MLVRATAKGYNLIIAELVDSCWWDQAVGDAIRRFRAG